MKEKRICELKGYENIKPFYFIREDGNIISYSRLNPNGKILKAYKNIKAKGYIQVHCSNRVIKPHRLVALAYIPNPLNKPQVNHINGDKNDNSIGNLEWCTNLENMRHSWEIGLRNNSIKSGCYNYQYDKESVNCKKVIQMDLNGNEMQEFVSIAQACRAVNGKSYSNISKACKGNQKTAFGYKWKFK